MQLHRVQQLAWSIHRQGAALWTADPPGCQFSVHHVWPHYDDALDELLTIDVHYCSETGRHAARWLNSCTLVAA